MINGAVSAKQCKKKGLYHIVSMAFTSRAVSQWKRISPLLTVARCGTGDFFLNKFLPIKTAELAELESRVLTFCFVRTSSRDGKHIILHIIFLHSQRCFPLPSMQINGCDPIAITISGRTVYIHQRGATGVVETTLLNFRLGIPRDTGRGQTDIT